MAIKAVHKEQNISLHPGEGESVIAKVGGIFVCVRKDAHEALEGAKQFIDKCIPDHVHHATNKALEEKFAEKAVSPAEVKAHA